MLYLRGARADTRAQTGYVQAVSSTREQAGWSEGAGGLRALAWEVGAWGLSPDGEWLATADGLTDASGQSVLRCVEVATGRVVFAKPGAAVKGLGWVSPEALLVVREHGRGEGRALLHAVPDGGLLGHAPLAHVPGRVQVTPCEGAGLALVSSQRMTGGTRGEHSRRLVHVLRTDPLESAMVFDPDESPAVPRLPRVPDCAAGLSPDGRRLAVALDTALVLRELGSPRDVRAGEVTAGVGGLTWVDPDTLLAHPAEVDGEHPPQVELVSLAERRRLFSSAGEDPPQGWVGPRATVAVSPDRGRILVAGTAVTLAAAGAAGSSRALLRVIDARSGAATAPRELATVAGLAHGAQWLADGAIAVLTARRKKPVAELARLARLDDAPGPARVTVALTGKDAAGARLTRSRCGRYLVVAWRAAPEGRKRSEYGAVTATRLALVETAALAE